MALDISILVDIAVILIAAKVFGEAAERLKFPVLFGEMIGGLVIGALVIIKPTAFMNELASFGILFLFFMLGLTLKVADIRKGIKPTFAMAIAGTFVSFLLGFLFGYFMFADALKGLFVGVAIMSTSTAIALKSLHDAGELNTKVFNLASAVSRIDDVVAILMITVITTLMLIGPKFEMILFIVAVVLAVFLLLEKWIAEWIGKFLELFKQLKDEYIIISLALVVLFVVSFLVQKIGIGSAIGAFLAGYALSKSSVTEEEILPKMKTIGYGFFIPLFFTYAAMSADFGTILNSLGSIIILFILAILAKFIGTAILAWWEGYKGHEVGLLGSAMMPRGEYAIAIAYIALSSQFIDKQLYSMLIVFVLLTILVTPIAFRIVKRKGY
ncbi:MAG: cation:proton antiporter [Candidatus Aenigmarchaeota archaeon]|nr:cation:proton antiporter [Candidatus Aenigmarchaeota archaeon]